jgi:glycosyltransferase involved in cell wall biosynthesis
MDNNKISFIVPVYNAESYLTQCIESILKQKSGLWELLLVDDGSSDSSQMLCQKYAEMYDEIKSFTIDNSGSATARNVGMEKASYDWIAFVDADDWITDNYVETICPFLMRNYDFIMFSYNNYFSGNAQKARTQKSIKELGKADFELLEKDSIDSEKRFSGVAPCRSQLWTKVYKRNFLIEHKIWLNSKLLMSHDIVFNMYVYKYARMALYIPSELYNYRILGESNCHRYSDKQIERIMCLLYTIYDYIKSNEYKLYELYQKRILVSLIKCCTLDLCHNDNPQQYKIRKKRFMELRNQEIFNNALRTDVIRRFSFKKQCVMYLLKMNKFWMLNLLIKINASTN